MSSFLASGIRQPASGTLVCVGAGVALGFHIGALSRSHIEKSDVVFVAVADGAMKQWLMRMHPGPLRDAR